MTVKGLLIARAFFTFVADWTLQTLSSTRTATVFTTVHSDTHGRRP